MAREKAGFKRALCHLKTIFREVISIGPYQVLKLDRIAEDGNAPIYRAKLVKGPKWTDPILLSKLYAFPGVESKKRQIEKALELYQKQRPVFLHALLNLIGGSVPVEYLESLFGYTNQEFVLKRIHLQAEDQYDLVRSEIQAHEICLGHPNIMLLLGHTVIMTKQDKSVYLLLPAFKMSLRDHYQLGHPWNETTTLGIFREICQGLAHIHSNGYLHLDIEPGNVLLSQDRSHPILLNFGRTSGRTSQLHRLIQARESSPNFCAPELLDVQLHVRISKATDVWSCGVLLYTMFYGPEDPFESSPHEGSQTLAILHGALHFPPEPVLPPSVHTLIRHMLSILPQDRPSVPDILQTLDLLLPEREKIKCRRCHMRVEENVLAAELHLAFDCLDRKPHQFIYHDIS